MKKKKIRSGLFTCALLLSCLSYTACDDSSSAVKEPPRTGGPGADSGPANDAGTLPDGATKDCFDNPKTHFEIINACTTAAKVTKTPTLTKLLPDGGLPPLN
jgi:hypothetical protein